MVQANTRTVLDMGIGIIPEREYNTYETRWSSINSSVDKLVDWRSGFKPAHESEAEDMYTLLDDAKRLYNDVKNSYGKNYVKMVQIEEEEAKELKRQELWGGLSQTLKAWVPPKFPTLTVPEFPTIPSGRPAPPPPPAEPEYREEGPTVPITKRLANWVEEHTWETIALMIGGSVATYFAFPAITKGLSTLVGAFKPKPKTPHGY
jgi:hypothetical protein